jgi:hypothetical protein
MPDPRQALFPRACQKLPVESGPKKKGVATDPEAGEMEVGGKPVFPEIIISRGGDFYQK